MPNLVWIDTETTGLDENWPTGQILEIGCVITDSELNELDAYSVVIHASEEVLANMEPVAGQMHAKNGLTEACRQATITQTEAEAEVLAFISQYVAPKESALWGNSITHDRNFLKAYMPTVFNHLHYRMMDVSSDKIKAQLWYTDVPHFKKAETHRTQDDIRESVAELRYYRKHIMQPPTIQMDEASGPSVA
jgi:oligoribonuclease